MNKVFNYSILFMIMCFFFTSCKSKKGLFGKKKERGKANHFSFYNDSISTPIQYDYLSFKIQSKFDGESINSPVKSVKANIKIYKDSVIWASVTALLGIEAARVLVKNDSIFLLNRLNSTYTYGPISSFVKQLPSETSIGLMVQILLGKPILPKDQINETMLSSNADTVKIKHSFTDGPSSNSKYIYTSKFTKTAPYLLNQNLMDSVKSHYLNVNYSDFKSINIKNKQHTIPFKQDFKIYNGSLITILNTYSKMNTDKQTFNFKVPKNYKQIVY